MQTSRRSVLRGLATLLCAPAIVRAASLMPVSAAAFNDSSLWLTGSLADANHVLDAARYLAVSRSIKWPPGIRWPSGAAPMLAYTGPVERFAFEWNRLTNDVRVKLVAAA